MKGHILLPVYYTAKQLSVELKLKIIINPLHVARYISQMKNWFTSENLYWICFSFKYKYAAAIPEKYGVALWWVLM